MKGLNHFETAVVIKSSISCWIWMKTMVILVLLNYFNCSCLLCLLQTAEKLYNLPISLIRIGGWIILIATVCIKNINRVGLYTIYILVPYIPVFHLYLCSMCTCVPYIPMFHLYLGSIYTCVPYIHVFHLYLCSICTCDPSVPVFHVHWVGPCILCSSSQVNPQWCLYSSNQ